MDAKTKWLIVFFVYFIGAVGTFIVTFFDVHGQYANDMRAFETAAIAGVLWPAEIVKLIFKVF